MTTLTHLSPAPVIDETVRLLTEHYVFPEVAAELGSLLRRRFAEGSYDVDSAEELGRLRHRGPAVRQRRPPSESEVPRGPGTRRTGGGRSGRDAPRLRQLAGGAPRVELLDAGVAVVELAPALFPLEWAAEPLTAALSLAANARALVLDLRANLGGDPDTVAFVCSHLLDERTHLNTMFWRAG